MRYVAIVTPGAVRDMQVCRDENYEDLFSNEWKDSNLTAYIGIFEEESIEDILKRAAAGARTVPENIELIPV